MAEVVELSIEETNALRAKLGLGPLRVNNPPSLSSNPSRVENEQNRAKDAGELVRSRIEESKRRRRAVSSFDDGDDEEELGLDEEQLAQVENGAVLVLDDVNVLGDGDSGERKGKRKQGGLVIPGEGSKVEEDDDDTEQALKNDKKKKLNKQDFIGAKARRDGTIHQEDTETNEEHSRKAIPGARLFESDLPTLNDDEVEGPKKKKSKREAQGPQQVKIVRRQVHRGVAHTADGEDEPSPSQVPGFVPRIYGTGGMVPEDEEEDELEASLSRARRANISNQHQKIRINDILSSSDTAPLVSEDFEVYVPVNDYSGITINTKNNEGDVTHSSTDSARVAEQQDDILIKMEVEGNVEIGMDISAQTINQQVGPADSEIQPKVKEKTHRRGLAATLSLMRETGEGKSKDEVVVGRARDARPVANLNNPEDLVKLEYRDDHGRLLTQKEAYRQLKYQFRGEGPGAKKQAKREKQLQRELAARSDAAGVSSAGPGVKDLLQGVKKDHLVLWKS